jgi:predicted Ser/Thr protein kinase
MANLDKMDANQHNMEATIRGGQEETIKSITGACRESTEACEEKTKALPETTKQIIEEFMAKMEAGLRAIITENLRKMEEKKPAAEETEAVAESPKEERMRR